MRSPTEIKADVRRSAWILFGTGFGQRRFDDGAFAVHLGGIFGALGVRGQVDQFVLGLGLQLLVVLGFLAHQALLTSVTLALLTRLPARPAAWALEHVLPRVTAARARLSSSVRG